MPRVYASHCFGSGNDNLHYKPDDFYYTKSILKKQLNILFLSISAFGSFWGSCSLQYEMNEELKKRYIEEKILLKF